MSLIKQHEGLLTVHLGPVGSGKTYSMVVEALAALRRNEPVFTNVTLNLSHLEDLKDIPTYETVDLYGQRPKSRERGPAIVRWSRPVELVHPEVRCGKILFDELGALINSRESDVWPFPLTVKLIHLRKHHLSVDASAQDFELADKNFRRFINRCWIMKELRIPLAAFFKKNSIRPAVECELPGCTKNDHMLTEGDRKGKFPWYATVYARKDVHPQYTQNKEKHMSKGTKYIWFDPDIAKCYITAQSVEADAVQAYEQACREASAWDRKKKMGMNPQRPAEPVQPVDKEN